MSVYLLVTLDTKGPEAAFVRDRLRALGVPVVVVDTGCLGGPPWAGDVTRAEVFAAAGTTLAALQENAPRSGRGLGCRGCGQAGRAPRRGANSTASWRWAVRPARRSGPRPCAVCRSACRS